MTESQYYVATTVIFFLSAIAALIMIGIAVKQLSKLASQVEAAVKANSLSQLNALIGLEQQLAERRSELSSAGIHVNELRNVNDQDRLDAAALRFNEAKQMYLNGLDRLCFCVLKGLFQDDDIRLEYRDTIKSAMKDFPDSFGPATSYRNISKVHEKWADK